MNHGGPQLIAFTRAREESDLWKDGHVRKCRDGDRRFPAQKGSLEGEAARNFYESLLAPGGEGKLPPRKRRAARRCQQRLEAPNVQPGGTGVRRELGSTDAPTRLGGTGTPREQGQTGSLNRPRETDALNQPEQMYTRKGNQLLKSAQDGNLRALQKLVENEGCNVNYRDGYYWTAMMCAAYAGQRDAVRYLLSHGAAWVGVCETQGRDAMDLAEEAGHQDVIDVLRESERPHRTEEEAGTSSGGAPSESKYCAVCRMNYTEDNVALHERSTVHLFNRRDPLPPTRYHIPESNVGFQLMVKGGWDRETGLGPDGTGRKFPVQTVLKRDQQGLGFCNNLKPKVTHFNANDPSAVTQPAEHRPRTERVATVGKREARRREAKAKVWERNLRTYMNLDL
uniref:G-patch domain and ankyrin repeats 1 n=1 Tax=Sphenodon punctatus TaxID=8508 RepID=A0A8D0HKZ5_SPHPU